MVRRLGRAAPAPCRGAHAVFGYPADRQNPPLIFDFLHPELLETNGWEAPGFAAFVSSIIESGTKPSDMDAIRARVPPPVLTAEDVDWRGDSIEAEAFAYLGARSMLGLPISFPGTTGVPAPMTGGRIAMP